MDSNFSFRMEGFEELAAELSRLSKKYPERSGELLKQEAKNFRKEVIKNVKKDTHPNADNKRSLSKASQYKISQVQGFGDKQFVEISAKSPHFHLVEHGHEMIMPYTHGIKGVKGAVAKNENGGQRVGFVEGKHMMDKARRTYEERLPEAIDRMVDELLSEGGFL